VTYLAKQYSKNINALPVPTKMQKEFIKSDINFERLKFHEILKLKPFSAVYDYYSLINNVPVGEDRTIGNNTKRY
jgi:L-rhamnose isomerase